MRIIFDGRLPKILKYTLLLLFLLGGCISFLSCSHSDAPVSSLIETPDGIYGTLTAADYSVKAGETVYVAGDLTIEASGDVDIAGELMAKGDKGQNITINAGGSVTVSGKIAAGNAATGANGGNLTIKSTGGNITLSSSAAISGGDGFTATKTSSLSKVLASADGTVSVTQVMDGAPGTNGGSVTLRAPTGSITVPYVQGLIHLGNGGNGADVTVSGTALLSTTLPEQMTNNGGHSGRFILDSPTVSGITMGTTTLLVDFTDPATGITYKAGEEIPIIADTYPFTGGKGGNAGNVYYGLDASGNSTWPSQSAMKMAVLKESTVIGANAQFEMLYVKGPSPGWSDTEQGGQSADIFVKGQDGTEYGVLGQDVWVEAGYSFNNGKPGNAMAVGGKGADGAKDSPGEKGGFAWAVGGHGSRMGPDVCGGARAIGGKGGNGGSGCPDSYGGKGGMGGTGRAQLGDNYDGCEELGQIYAEGGKGGNGGAGVSGGNWGGEGGKAEVYNARHTAVEGESGGKGGSCEQLSLTITPTNSSILVGGNQQYTLTGTPPGGQPQDMTGDATWISETPAVATVTDGGLATGVGEGTTRIWANVSDEWGFGHVATATLTVTAVNESLRTTPVAAAINVNSTQQFTATYTREGVETDVSGYATWQSSAPTVATVNSSGLAACISAGSTVISAAYTGQKALTSSSNLDCLDETPSFSLVSTTPVNGGTVATGTPVVFTFDQEVDSSSIYGAFVARLNSGGSWYDNSLSCSRSSSNTKVVNCVNGLFGGTWEALLYEIRVQSTLKSTGGLFLSNPTTMQFTGN